MAVQDSKLVDVIKIGKHVLVSESKKSRTHIFVHDLSNWCLVPKVAQEGLVHCCPIGDDVNVPFSR